MYYQIDLSYKYFWHFLKGYSVLVQSSKHCFGFWEKSFPFSPPSIVAECGLISSRLKFLTLVIIPEWFSLSFSASLSSSPFLSPSLLRWAKWLRCGDRERFLSAAVQMQGQLKEAYAHLRMEKYFYSRTERLWAEHLLISTYVPQW